MGLSQQERPVPMRVSWGALGIPVPSMLGPKTLCGVSAGTSGFLSSADMDLGLVWGFCVYTDVGPGGVES